MLLNWVTTGDHLAEDDLRRVLAGGVHRPGLVGDCRDRSLVRHERFDVANMRMTADVDFLS